MTVSPMPEIFAGFLPDCRRYSVPVAVLRAIRSSRILGMRQLQDELNDLPAFQRHMLEGGASDPLFFLSHRYFLAQGLSANARAEAALAHYRHESTMFTDDYLEQVYRGGGLLLWSRTVEDVAYDIRLMPGHDVLHEGGLSIVLHVDGGRVCVLSYSTVPLHLLQTDTAEATPEPAQRDALVPFLVRKQLAHDHSYQVAFNKAFDRATPAHLCLGALAGVALPQGLTQAFGVDAERQVSYEPSRHADFARSYAEFWTTVGGTKVSPFGFLIDLPMKLSSLEDMNARQRKRARVRRAHIDGVQASADQAIRACLRSGAA